MSSGSCFRDLPFGAYNVAVSLPVDATHLEAPKPVPFDLRGASPCALVDFFVSKRTRLWGLVTDLQGRPAAGVFVLATPAAVKRMTGGRPGRGTHSDEKGATNSPASRPTLHRRHSENPR